MAASPLDNAGMSDTRPVVDWLINGARPAATPQEMFLQLCTRLVAGGIPLWRAGIFVRTLHPDIIGRSFLWRADGEVVVNEAPFEFLGTEEYRKSPILTARTSGKAIRRRLLDPESPLDFPILLELRAEGVTDYLVSPLFFSNGEIHAVSWATRAPQGFSEADIAGLEAVAAPLARVAEGRAWRRVAGVLLDTYVGHRAGERILAGQIRRGHTETIAAAIWLSDLRDFTELTDHRTTDEVIAFLNGYFDCQVPAIAAEGGEVLKFMGDGLLAIFPLEAGRDAEVVCAAALAAARAAAAAVGKLDALGDAAGVRFGLALHIGDLLYGNIGGGNRLDFTAIGPAVNLTSRLERLARDLGQTVVASGEFARHCPAGLEPLGSFALRGFGAPQTVFGLAKTGDAR